MEFYLAAEKTWSVSLSWVKPKVAANMSQTSLTYQCQVKWSMNFKKPVYRNQQISCLSHQDFPPLAGFLLFLLAPSQMGTEPLNGAEVDQSVKNWLRDPDVCSQQHLQHCSWFFINGAVRLASILPRISRSSERVPNTPIIMFQTHFFSIQVKTFFSITL